MSFPSIDIGSTWTDNLKHRTIRVLGTRAGMVAVAVLSDTGKDTGKRFDMWCGLWQEKMSNNFDNDGRETMRLRRAE